MVRLVTIGGFAALFLLISPKLRGDVWGALGKGVNTMDFYAPYSYIAGGLLLLATLLISFTRGARAR